MYNNITNNVFYVITVIVKREIITLMLLLVDVDWEYFL